MVEQLPDSHMVLRLGDTSGDYYRWKASVLQVRLLPEYKLRKLWKMNFSVKDIEADKHWAIFPPDRAKRVRKVLGRQDDNRGRAIGADRKAWLYARALCDVAQGLLQFHALTSAMRAETMAELENFKALMKKHAHKKNSA